VQLPSVGQGQTLVLLHGWGFNSELFNTLIEQYKNQYRITVIDLPGHGRSDEVKGGVNAPSHAIKPMFALDQQYDYKASLSWVSN
jgi:pimeloyl-ACP methyl ester carboxylesterase